MRNCWVCLSFLPVFCLVVSVVQVTALAATEVTNSAELRSRLGLGQYNPGDRLGGLKIAVLDNGFAGFAQGRGQLPDSTEVIEGPGNTQAPTTHGLGMAEII